MAQRTECPKCGSQSARHERLGLDIWLRCMCGYAKVVYTRIETIEIEHVDSTVEVRLPRQGTKLHNTLMCLSALKKATSQEITQSVNDLRLSEQVFSVAEISSYLTLLKQRGLVRPLDSRRGLSGGSTWVITDDCNALLGV